MKIDGEYRMRDIGLRQWRKLATEVRRDAEAFTRRVRDLTAQLADHVANVRHRMEDEGLSHATVTRRRGADSPRRPLPQNYECVDCSDLEDLRRSSASLWKGAQCPIYEPKPPTPESFTHTVSKLIGLIDSNLLRTARGLFNVAQQRPQPGSYIENSPSALRYFLTWVGCVQNGCPVGPSQVHNADHVPAQF